MKRLAALLALQTLLTLTSLTMASVYYLDDGASHTFDYTTTPLYGDDATRSISIAM